MADDLNRMTTRGPEMEIFEAENAWDGASPQVYIQTNRFRGGVYQMGYDPVSNQHWMRALTYDDADPEQAGTWSAWGVFPPVAPPPPEAGRRAAAAAAPEPDRRKR